MGLFTFKDVTGGLARRAGKRAAFQGLSVADLVAGQGEEIDPWEPLHFPTTVSLIPSKIYLQTQSSQTFASPPLTLLPHT